MPNLSDFLQIGDELFCWDADIEEYIQIDKKRITDSKKYKKVVATYKKNCNSTNKENSEMKRQE